MIEDAIDKLNKLNDSIKAKVDDPACFHPPRGVATERSVVALLI